MNVFEQFVINTQDTIPVFGFIINFLLTFLLSFLLATLYKTFGKSLSDREVFSKNFIIISLTTMLIITIIKSSLALSLGLVGALSIIRFRTAIKEPEELSFLFLAIAIGLGFGANQTYVTIVGFLLSSIIIIILSYQSGITLQTNNMYLSIENNTGDNLNNEEVKQVVLSNCSEVKLKRYDRSGKHVEFLFIIKLISNKHLNILDQKIKELYPEAKISFLDHNDNSL